MEPHRSLWKMQDQSIGKLGKQGEEWSGIKYKIGRKELGKKRGSP